MGGFLIKEFDYEQIFDKNMILMPVIGQLNQT